MPDSASTWLLLSSTVSIGVLHSLAPDHWVPFVSIGRARKWPLYKLAWVTFLCGIGHVGSSVIIGSLGLVLGLALSSLEVIESQRAQVAGLLLIGFGLAYAVWGIKHSHHHGEKASNPSLTVWALMMIFVLGPCEPLIPLMFLGAAQSWMTVVLVTLLFAVVTLIMMVAQALLGYSAANLVVFKRIEKYGHSVAGIIIAFTGGVIMVLGI